MFRYGFLALFPAVLACTNPDTNLCASFISANKATASPFCVTFTQSTVTATTSLPAWASNCSNKPKEISKECSCYYTGGAGSTPTSIPAGTTFTTQTTTGPTPTNTSGGNTCGSAAVDGLVGYAAGTTGGGTGSGVTVTSCSALSSAVGSAGVIKISGILTGCGIIDLKSGTTVLGVGSNAGLTDGGFRLKSISNVIIRNLKFHNPPEGKDLVSLDVATKVWVDHCDFSTVGLTGDKDYYDGLLDITHASDYVTVSWNKFHDHWKGSLVGHSDSNSGEDTGHLRITYHHNHWTNVNSRLPSLRFGTGHIYSSCFENNPTSGINSRMGAQVLVEQCYFSSTNLAITTNLDSDEEGYAVSRNNTFVDSTTDITQTGSLTPPYSYVTDSASCVCTLVKSQAGTGIIG